ncbi:splicing factor, arginine/serine-rich 19 [Cyclopterus lumpus]|uniref:splicing factor, arginine/serine-rich 19 n=1 Tax=Cyclopterus lumpus TaxID=8103 RepID=UPI0014869A36|nr:splicing factor, arginine/serine-rich 19 [Cyclopterus lumpus]XP_034395141.1 splicing factor, arginine/serine-rich 19 [Cyclopterus lumpus]XP_034395142.1 splicing factor, arginine/serine-rich 19 [Cyclopterus lumpus]XP_034395143.1 splicing factor, arginine/serine-rich 19 [Cyclopterus lumpus]
MDLTPVSGFRRRPAASSSPSGIRETARSPPPCSPSLSPSSPSSDLSSPLSTSSSVCANSSAYQNHVKGQTQGSEVARVSSTSASLATQSFSTLTPNTTSSKLFPHKSMHPRVYREEEGGKREMYDPFQPTEGVKEEKGEKYDPFDPTGSPASEDDDDDESGKMRGVKRNSERGDDEEKEEEPPDSTDTLTDLPSPGLSTQLPLRRRVECFSAKSREQRSADSDHSEIEEGEIVGAADRDGGNKRPAGEVLPMNSPSVSFFGSKPERILRVLDGDGFVSVRTESNWEVDREPEDEPVVGVEDLRRKLVSRRKERYLSFPASSPLSPQPPPPSHPPVSTPSSPLTAPVEQATKNRSKSSKSSKDSDRQKSKDRKAGEKEERKKKSKKDKEGGRERSKEKERGHKTGKEVKGRRSSRSSSRKRKKRQHSSPEASRSCNSSGRGGHTRQPLSSLSEERHREKEREKDRNRESDRDRGRERDREREQNRTSSHRRDERDRDSSPRKEEKERKGRQHSSSRERGISKRSKRSREKREGDRDRQRERERGRDGRPVVPPSIQDLNGSDLFAIKRTITVTTTTTTTTVPGSPRLAPTSPCRPTQDSDKPHKRKKKRKWHSAGEMDDRGSCHSQSQSISPPRYHSYDSDHYSDKLVIDVLSLDGEALDSDYPSLEDTPPAALPPEPPVPSPKTKTTPKTGKHHPKKKSHALKKIEQSSTSSSSSKGKCLSSLTVTSGSAAASSGLPSTKRARKMGKDKVRDKGSRKDLGHSGKSKKESGGSRKGKLQSKVSVLVREGVSSTTGTSVGSGKMGMDLLGPGGTGVGAGGSVVGDSIAVVFCRDNESRSPFLKPCSEPLSLGNRSKDLASMGKRSSLVAPPSSLTSPAGLKSKKAKPSSITSTSSSASSPSSSLATKRRRRLAKKTREKGGVVGLAAGDDSQTKAPSEGWGGASLDVQSAIGDRGKSISPRMSQAGPAPCCSSSSSSSSSTSVLPPSSSPPHTPPPSMAPLRDTRESSPDSQTVDSSCKTPDPSFLAEDCPTQTSPTLPASSPSSLSTPQGAGLSIALSTPTAKPPPPDQAPKSLASPPCSSSSAGCGFTSLSLPLSLSDPSSSSVSSSSASKPPPPPPPAVPGLPWSLQTGVDCTTGGVLALTALLFKMEEANIASRAKAQEFIQATSQILSQANQSQSQQLAPPSSASSSHIPPSPSLPPPLGLSPAQFILHSSLPLVGSTKTPPSLLHPSIGGGCAQTPPSIMSMGLSGSFGDTGWDNESKDPDKYLKKLHTQERAVEEVKLAIKPYYQRKDINKDDYKDILRKAVHKICHSRTGEINPVKVSNLVKLYVQRYKYFRKHGRRMDEEERDDRELHSSA